MAVITGSGSVNNEKYWLHTWEGLGAGDTGRPVRMSGLSDKTVMVDGTFGGTTVTIQGSQDSETWHTLTDPQGEDLTFTAAGGSVISENPRFVRPSTTGGTSPDVNVRLGASAIA